MLRGLYTAYTGMNAQQQRMDTISNNLANVNTTAYKKDGVFFESFNEVYVRKINDPETVGGERIGKMSFGVRVGETYVDHSQGALQQTGLLSQIGIQGDGFLAVGTMKEDGTFTENYTRDGSFHINANGELMTLSGQYVLDTEGQKIIINDVQNMIINQSGVIFEGTSKVATMKLVDFEDPAMLNKLGNSLYTATTDSVEKPFEGEIMQGFLEGSNVSSVEEMINMINVMRTYESNQKVLTTYDATLEQAVTQIGRV